MSVISVPHYDSALEKLAPKSVPDGLLTATISAQLLHDACQMYDSNLRVGTAKTKTRAEVQGSSKKLYKQKGTGRARAGNRRTPVRVGGGHAFAKRPRNWYYRLPKKSLKLATRMALQYKLLNGQCCIVDAIGLVAAKTRLLSSRINAIGLGGRRVLIVTPEFDKTLVTAAANLPDVTVCVLSDLNASSILRCRVVVLLGASLELLSAAG